MFSTAGWRRLVRGGSGVGPAVVGVHSGGRRIQKAWADKKRDPPGERRKKIRRTIRRRRWIVCVCFVCVERSSTAREPGTGRDGDDHPRDVFGRGHIRQQQGQTNVALLRLNIVRVVPARGCDADCTYLVYVCVFFFVFVFR